MRRAPRRRLGRGRRRDLRLRQPGGRGQSQRRAHGLLLAGLPVSVPGTTINRLCGSGMDAVITAARAIKAGEARAHHRRRRREHEPRAVRHAQGRDGVFAQRRDLRHHHRLALRQPADEEALRRRFDAGDRRERRRGLPGSAAPTRTPSRCARQQRAVAAQQNGRLAREIVPVTIPQRKGDPMSSTRTSTRAPTPRSRRWRSCRRRSATAAR